MIDTPATTATKLTIDEPVAPPKNELVTAELVAAGALLLDVVASCRTNSVGAGVGAGAMSNRQAAVDDAGSKRAAALSGRTGGRGCPRRDSRSSADVQCRAMASGDAWTLR